MKIAQLLNGVGMAVTNEESRFIEKYGKSVRLTTLDEHAKWIAQNLVRKGVYSISKDNNTLIKETHEDIL
jgi:hypothetical protein